MKATLFALLCVSSVLAIHGAAVGAPRRTLLAPGDAPPPGPAKPEYFIEVRDGAFANGCDNFKIAGWNQWEVVEAAAGAPSISGASLPPGVTGPELVRNLLQRGSELGLNVMRTWAHAVNPQYALQPKAGEFNDATFEGLDYVLDEARKANVKLILAFTSNWTPTGGLPEFVKWANLTSNPEFYTSPETKQMYKDTVETIINRRNSINGRLYRDDPTIMAWNLLNEPRCAKCAPGTVAAWYDEMAEFVKSIDPNHLVTTGEEGLYGCAENAANPGAKDGGTWACEEGQDFLKDHASPNIDFATIHSWPDNWGDVSLEFQRNFILQHVKDAGEILKKPVILEEWGKWVNESANATMEDRNTFMAAVFKDLEEIMSEPNSPLQGSAFWQWYAEGQEAAPTEGGGAGLFGIRESDETFDYIKDNAKFIQSLNTPIEGCSTATHKAADVAPVDECRATWVDGRPGTGLEGPGCKNPVNECVRGTDHCDKNAACIDSEVGYECKCYPGYDGDGATCTPNAPELAAIKAKYWTEPKGLSCKEGLPVEYPINSPGFVYDPMNSFAFYDPKNGGKLGSKANVTLEQCMTACEMAPTCESFVYNDVLLQCFLARGQCPVYNYCQGEQAKCESTNDRGGKFSFDCGFWESYYRLDSDAATNCEGFKPNPASVGVANPEALAVFQEYQTANPTAVLRKTPATLPPAGEPAAAAAAVPLIDEPAAPKPVATQPAAAAVPLVDEPVQAAGK